MDDRTFVIIGAKGQLGTALREKYPNARAVDSDELDITNAEAVRNFDWSDITTILNAAVYANVDGSETTEGRVAAWRVNATGPRNLAEVAGKHGLTLLHISSDYVFDGTQKVHTEDEPLSPLGVYGQAKAAGDLAVSLTPKHYICRTTWLIGEGKNFVRTMLALGKKGINPTVVGDQIGRLTFTSELVRVVDHLLSNGAAFGTYNATNSGDIVSWAEITRAIFKDAGYDLIVTDTATKEYYASKEGVAPRPLNSEMDLSKLQATGFESRDWRDDLAEYTKKEMEQQ